MTDPQHPRIIKTALVCSALAPLLLAACSRPPTQTAELAESISFNEHVRPILTENCVACHGGVKKAGGVSFIYREEALGYGDSGKQVVKPGAPAKSELFRRITSTDPEQRMPPADHGDPLDESQIAILKEWIQDGAEWEAHWAYEIPKPPELPMFSDSDWPRNEIDRFALAKMREQDLSPNPEQERARLFRRLSLDLIGLPPTPSEMERFLADSSDDAYERQVDRLLASPHFGERWATPWLDLARYAESKGFERDPHRDMWPYRDWVIRALNADMPFDAFTLKQLAGDLLPDPSLDDLVATAFHRNTKTNVEGGTDDEEYRTAAVIDRVNTTWQSWMGTSFGCVQCHSHPYDPLPHESYYRFAAFFNNTQDHDVRDEYPNIQYADDPEKRDELFRRQLDLRAANTAFVRPFQELASNTEWSPLAYQKATSTQGVVIAIQRDETGAEVLKTGPNTPKGSVHTLVAETTHNQIAALRIDGLMQDGKSIADPGDPFILSFIELSIIPPEGEPVDVCFDTVISDEANPRIWPELSLKKENKQGWAAYPKQHYPRWAVFIPDEPIPLPEKATLKITLHHLQGHDGAQQPVLRHFQISVDDRSEWTDLAASEPVSLARNERSEALEAIKAIERTPLPIFRERQEDFARVTNVFIRGDWLDKGDRVEPGIPPLFQRVAEEPIQNRLELARWIVSDENPLTARFTVNRFWEQLFGQGIVTTLEDFGAAGTPPSHPELLDYLALEFQNHLGWSVKRLLRKLVLSATYRQSPVASAEKRQIDPRNRFLSRGPRLRLTAEMVRDNALVASGLFVDTLYGKPVMPPQPKGVWRTARNKQTWENSEGEDRYRRAIYTYWKRTAPYPSFLTFDAPTRDLCAPRRTTTNTPLQALVTMNDPVYVECAERLAQLAIDHGGQDPESWIRFAYQRAILETPKEADVDALATLYREARKAYGKDPEADPAANAMTVVANAILNLDAFLTK